MSGKKSAPRSGASSRALAKAFSHDDPNLEGPGSSSYDRALDHKDSRKGKGKGRDYEKSADPPRPPSPPQLPTSSSKGKGRSSPKHLRSEDPNREGPDFEAWDRALASKDQRKDYTPTPSASNRSPSPQRPSGSARRKAPPKAPTHEDDNLEVPHDDLYGRGLGHHRKPKK